MEVTLPKRPDKWTLDSQAQPSHIAAAAARILTVP